MGDFEFPTESHDPEGRPYNPAMFAPVPDPTTRPRPAADGEVTVEQRTWEARMALHAIEGFSLGPWLSPHTRLVAVNGLLDAFDLDGMRKLMDGMAERTGQDYDPAMLDPGGEVRAFMEGPLGERMMAVVKEVRELLRTCADCGRVHGVEPGDDIETVGYLDAQTGDAVKVVGADRETVRVFRQVAPDQWDEEEFGREQFEKRFAKADDVPILGGES